MNKKPKTICFSLPADEAQPRWFQVEEKTRPRRHCLHPSRLRLPEPPPTCREPHRFMWLQKKQASPGGGLPSYSPPLPPHPDSCAHDTRVGFGPLYLRSVMSESLKRLGQFRGDKWWSERTADVGTQTFQQLLG